MNAKVTRLKVGQEVRVGLHTFVKVLEVTPSGKVVLRWSSEADAISVLPIDATTRVVRNSHPLRRTS